MEGRKGKVKLSICFSNKEELDKLTAEVNKKAEELQEAIQRLSDFQANFIVK